MEIIEVTAHFNNQGEVKLVDFYYRQQLFPVLSTGRQWLDGQGRHILVMVPEERVVELLFVLPETRWYLVIPSGELSTA